MTAINTWSTTAASNNSASPDGAPEGMPPSGVNNTIREIMAQVRTWHDGADWRNYADGVTHAITYVAATQFKTSGLDTTGVYTVGRRIHANGATTNDIFGIITASSFSTDTTVTVSWDGGASLQNEALTIKVGPDPTNQPALASGWQVVTAPTALGTETEIIVTAIAGYDYRFSWHELTPSADDSLAFALYVSGAYLGTDKYSNTRVSSTADVLASTNQDLQANIVAGDTTAAIPSSAHQTSNGFIELYQVADSTTRTTYSMETIGENASAEGFYRRTMGITVDLNAATQFKMFWTSGSTFGSNGYYAVYRRANGT